MVLVPCKNSARSPFNVGGFWRKFASIVLTSIRQYIFVLKRRISENQVSRTPEQCHRRRCEGILKYQLKNAVAVLRIKQLGNILRESGIERVRPCIKSQHGRRVARHDCARIIKTARCLDKVVKLPILGGGQRVLGSD